MLLWISGLLCGFGLGAGAVRVWVWRRDRRRERDLQALIREAQRERRELIDRIDEEENGGHLGAAARRAGFDGK